LNLLINCFYHIIIYHSGSRNLVISFLDNAKSFGHEKMGFPIIRRALLDVVFEMFINQNSQVHFSYGTCYTKITHHPHTSGFLAWNLFVVEHNVILLLREVFGRKFGGHSNSSCREILYFVLSTRKF